MPRFAPGFVLAAVLLALGACAPEPLPEEPLPLPPPSPPRLAVARQAVPPARPDGNGAAENGADPATGATGQASEPAAVTEAAATVPDPLSQPARQVWRVARDGTIGCADPNAVRLLRQLAGGDPRMLVEARAAGGCRTTFRVNEWVAEGGDAETVRMRLTNGAPLTLWFLRTDLAAP
jgi:hypothetical protein